MPTIPLTDKFGLAVDLKFSDKSAAAQAGLEALSSKVSEYVSASEKPLDQTNFHSAVFGGTFASPKIGLSDDSTLVIKNGSNVTISAYRNTDSTLFPKGGAAPDISIANTQAWIGLSIGTQLEVSAAAGSPAGFGVCGKAMQAAAVSMYTLVEASNGAFPTLRSATENALSQFTILRSATDIRNQSFNCVCEWDVSGSFTIIGSYAYQLPTNAFSLPTLALPFHHDLQVIPSLMVGLKGSLALKGEFLGRCYRAGGSKVQLGLYKKKDSDFTVSFDAQAGVSAAVGSTDLISALFSALPGAKLDVAQIPDADRAAMEEALSGAVDQGFSIALNDSCSASVTDEAAVLYEIDLSSSSAEVDAALNSALTGNWTLLGRCAGVREVRNIITETHEKGFKSSLNLLGLYDCASMQDFTRQCCILHDAADGTITITDKETAQRIAVDAAPFAAEDAKLRKVLDEAFLATVAYTAADSRAGLTSSIQATQSLLLYNEHSDFKALHKALLLGTALNLLSENDLSQIPQQKNFKYVRLSSRVFFAGEDALRLFFSDVAARTAYQLPDLKQLGRQVLASLLDRNQPADAARWTALMDDAIWANMEAQQFPAHSPASYTDWYDITSWAKSISTVSPRLKAVLDTVDTQKEGDPTKDATFMKERAALAKAVATVTHDTRAAFEKGWPIAVMFTLAGRRAPVSFTAQWDGRKQFDKQAGQTLTA